MLQNGRLNLDVTWHRRTQTNACTEPASTYAHVRPHARRRHAGPGHAEQRAQAARCTVEFRAHETKRRGLQLRSKLLGSASFLPWKRRYYYFFFFIVFTPNNFSRMETWGDSERESFTSDRLVFSKIAALLIVWSINFRWKISGNKQIVGDDVAGTKSDWL